MTTLDSRPPSLPSSPGEARSHRASLPTNPDETPSERVLRIALTTRDDLDAVKLDVGKPPNPVLGFEGSGLYKPVHEMLFLMRGLAKQKEWAVWATRVVVGALLVAAVSGGLVWLGGFHR